MKVRRDLDAMGDAMVLGLVARELKDADLASPATGHPGRRPDGEAADLSSVVTLVRAADAWARQGPETDLPWKVSGRRLHEWVTRSVPRDDLARRDLGRLAAALERAAGGEGSDDDLALVRSFTRRLLHRARFAHRDELDLPPL